jgi:integrase
MPESDTIPILIQFLYGEYAAAVLPASSERLLKWARAFDEWLRERKLSKNQGLYPHARLGWKYLLNLVRRPPWEIGPADIEGFRDAMLEQGSAHNTVRAELFRISDFYEWCGRRGIDPETEAGFNPAKEVRKPSVKGARQLHILSHEEAGALLGLLKADEALISRRDYAFLLSRLLLGVPNKTLRDLRWGQIELREGGAWVEWRPGKPKTPLPEKAWEAIHEYLSASGRIGADRAEGMPAEAYIFAPLTGPFGKNATGRAEEWQEGRSMTYKNLLYIVKTYGALAGIEAEKLNLPTLRYTAIAHYMETSPSTDELGDFLGIRQRNVIAQYRFRVRTILRQQPPGDFEARQPGESRVRRAPTSEDMFKHGMYSPWFPPGEIEAIMEAGIMGMKDETDWLDSLMNGAWERIWEPGMNKKAQVELGEAYSICTTRLSELLSFEKEGLYGLCEKDAEGVAFIQDYFKARDDLEGYCPTLEEIQEAVNEVMPVDERKQEHLSRCIARERLILYNLKVLAEETEDPHYYAYLLQKYGQCCSRLCRLLRRARPEPGRIWQWTEMKIEEWKAREWEYWRSQSPTMVEGWTGPVPGPGPAADGPTAGQEPAQ